MNCRLVRIFAVLAALICVAHASITVAQDETKKEAAESTPQEPTAPTEPMAQPEDVPGVEQEPTTPAPEGDKPAAPVAAPRTESTGEPRLLFWILRNSGVIGFVILIQSFLAVGLTIKYLIEMRRDKVIPPALVADFESRIRDKKYQEAYELARNNSSFLGKVLAAGLGKLSTGYPQAIEAMNEVGEDESMKLEHQLSYLAILGTTGPLLGLLGTVWGMVQSFLVIATSETQPKPSALAGGISNALVTTLEGMVVAIIATVAFMLLKNQAARLVLEVGMVSETLMSRFSSVTRPGRATATTAAGEPV